MKPFLRNHSMYAGPSALRSSFRNAAPKTLPPTTVAPLAANTMSGRPSIGLMESTWWPRSRYASRRASHWRAASEASTGSSGSIHGLME